MKQLILNRPRIPVLLFVATALILGSATSYALDTQPAKTSNLTGYELPTGTMRVSPASAPPDALKLLQTLVENSGIQLQRGQTEVLAWSGVGYSEATAADLMAEVSATLQGAGWRYEAKEENGGDLIRFTANYSTAEKKIIGYWVPTEEALILVWTVFSAKKPANKTLSIKPSRSTKAMPIREILPATTKAKTNVSNAKRIMASPSSLLGSWRWTTISASNYHNSTTGQVTDNAGGMSAAFTFSKNGRYKFNFYTRRRTYGMMTESWTTEEGTVTYGMDTFTLQPSKGHYRGSGAMQVNRPMRSSELKKRLYLWRWEMRNGKRQLMIGPSQSSMSAFNRGN